MPFSSISVMSFMKKRTMERKVRYFMPAIVQHEQLSCRQAKHAKRVNKKNVAFCATFRGSFCVYLHMKSFELLLLILFSDPYLSNMRWKITRSLGAIVMISKPTL